MTCYTHYFTTGDIKHGAFKILCSAAGNFLGVYTVLCFLFKPPVISISVQSLQHVFNPGGFAA